MKIVIEVKKTVDVKWLHVWAKVRYWEDSMINDQEDETGDLVPCKEGSMWKPRINVETGEIVNWTKGTKAEIHYKVCDAGTFRLLDSESNQILMKDGYVPSCMSPKESGYGDYIIMDIDENGIIADWSFSEEDIKDFQNG
jgi:hypothetical protein